MHSFLGSPESCLPVASKPSGFIFVALFGISGKGLSWTLLAWGVWGTLE